MRFAAICTIVCAAGFIALAQDQPAQIDRPHGIVVEGSVSRPGIYPILTPPSSNTVTTAIAQAGGLIQYADHKAFIIRVDEQGVTHTISVSLWDIINRRKPDIALQAGDVLQVPDSPKRRIAQKTLLPGDPIIRPQIIDPPMIVLPRGNPRPI